MKREIEREQARNEGGRGGLIARRNGKRDRERARRQGMKEVGEGG